MLPSVFAASRQVNSVQLHPVHTSDMVSNMSVGVNSVLRHPATWCQTCQLVSTQSCDIQWHCVCMCIQGFVCWQAGWCVVTVIPPEVTAQYLLICPYRVDRTYVVWCIVLNYISVYVVSWLCGLTMYCYVSYMLNTQLASLTYMIYLSLLSQ